jgi:hypothetical protein
MSGRTAESITEEETFTKLVRAVTGLRARVTLDTEGWPTVPARNGRLEWRGQEAAGLFKGSARIYAYTDRNRILSKLWAVPGVHRCQTGSDEGVVSMAADDHAAVRACARLLKCQTNGRASNGSSPERMAALRALSPLGVTA